MKNIDCLELDGPGIVPGLAGLAEPLQPHHPEGVIIPASVAAAPVDADGLPVPPPYASGDYIIPGWMKLTPKMRLERSEKWVADQIAAANAPRRTVAPRSPSTRFSTRAAIQWGKKKGWSVIAVEEDRAYQVEGKWVRRSADQKYSADVVFRAPGIGVVAVQAAVRWERKEHWERFVGLSGPERAHEVYDAFYYQEYERGVEEPILDERWI